MGDLIKFKGTLKAPTPPPQKHYPDPFATVVSDFKLGSNLKHYLSLVALFIVAAFIPLTLVYFFGGF